MLSSPPESAAAMIARPILPVSAATLKPKQAPLIMQPSVRRLITSQRSVTVSPSAAYSTDVPERMAPVSANWIKRRNSIGQLSFDERVSGCAGERVKWRQPHPFTRSPVHPLTAHLAAQHKEQDQRHQDVG